MDNFIYIVILRQPSFSLSFTIGAFTDLKKAKKACYERKNLGYDIQINKRILRQPTSEECPDINDLDLGGVVEIINYPQ